MDHSIEVPLSGSCEGREDGTKCNKKCKDYNCEPPFARCWQVTENIQFMALKTSLLLRNPTKVLMVKNWETVSIVLDKCIMSVLCLCVKFVKPFSAFTFLNSNAWTKIVSVNKG